MLTFEQSAIKARHSVRQFTLKPLDDTLKKTIEAFIATVREISGLDLTLVTDEPDAFGKSFMAHYGKFRNVRNYICIAGGKDEGEAVGYWGEAIVLKMQELGLNTCWCGLTFSKKNLSFEIPAGKKLHVVIALGYGENQGKQHRSKSYIQIAPGYDLAPSWFRKGVDCALLAPTAINQQKFHFEYHLDGTVRAWTDKGPFALVDLGIAKLHFEIGAEKEIKWIK